MSASGSPAYRIDDAQVSREAFYASACDPRRSVVVEACAGAGKTWMLVSRILRALLDGAQPQEILAITYTRKAAGEMRERLDGWLREFASRATSDAARIEALVARGMSEPEAREAAPRLATLHQQLLLRGRAVEIRTFHAWFAQLLRAAPLEMLDEIGLRRDVELVEDITEHLGAVHRRFNAVLLQDAALRADHAALVAQRGRSQVRRWLDTVLNRRIEVELADGAGTLDDAVPPASALWPALAGVDHPMRLLLDARGRSMLQDAARAMASMKESAARRTAIDAIAAVLGTPHIDPAAALATLKPAFFTNGGSPRKLGDLPDVHALQDALQTVGDQIAQQDAHVEHRRMARLARRLLVEYAAYKRQRGLADMSDLEHGALTLLRDSALAGWVQERLDARVRHLLVDEFQDTSPLQWHALHAWLASYAGAGGGASGQRPPSVFIVGDPKQSIYRFRRAEPRVFAAAQRFIAEAFGGQRLACDHTRRNAPEIIGVLNEVFTDAERAQCFDGFRTHTTDAASQPGDGASRLPMVLRADRRKGGEPPAGWRDSLTTPRREPDEVLREREASAVADAVVAAIADGQPAGSIMVLSRRRETLGIVAQALQRHHVPFVAAEELKLSESPEVLDLIAVLDVLASPRHRLSLARALRSPLLGASDDDLIALAKAAGDSGDWWGTLLRGPHDSPALKRAAELLARWHQAARELPPHDVLALVVHEGELRQRLAARVPPERRAQALEAVDALLAQALILDAGRYSTPYSFVRALKRRPIKFEAAARPDAVQLLTVHGAKGLEADLVFIVDAAPQPRGADTASLLVDWPVDMEHPARCAFLYSEAACPVSLRALLADEIGARDREEYNGLYVAMTRARRRLVVSATEPSRAPTSPSWWDQVSPHVPPWTPPAGVALPKAGSGRAAPPLRLVPALPASLRPAAEPPSFAGSPSTRLGQAVHRVLEWATASGDDVALEDLAAGAAAEFDAPADEVARIAGAILANPAARRFFHGEQIDWAGNEVALMHEGQPQRIDRLVRLREGDGAVWWVLDYKLQHRPQEVDAYRDQMRRYRAAVRGAQPDDPVRSALIGGNGEVIEID